MAAENDSSARPLRRDAQRNRERILAVANDLFAARGVEVSLDDVAATAGLGVGTVYRHYPTKDALLDELFEARINDLANYVEIAVSNPDPWSGLIGFIEHLAASFAENRAMEEIVLHPERGEQRVAKARARLADPVVALVDRAKASGQLDPAFQPADIEQIQTMLAAVIRGTEVESPGLWRRYFALIVDGLASRRPGAQSVLSHLDPA